MPKINLFIPISKVDEAKRLVYGVASREELDKTNEIFDYDSSKPFIQAWSDSFAQTTKAAGQEVSYGNLRAMHKAISAGKLNEPVTFHDTEKAVTVCAKVTDDQEWAKCLDGTYTGFSFGGKSVGAKWPDPDLGGMRYTLNPSELSLADSPCVKSAVFYDVVKIGGKIERRQHKSVGEGGDNILKTGKPIQKGMYGVRTLAGLLEDINYLQQDTDWESQWEGDNSPLPGQLKEWLKQGSIILVAMVKEETAELTGADPNMDPDNIAAVAPTGDLAKAGARNSKKDQESVQAVHDHAVNLGAECKCTKCSGTADKVDPPGQIQKTTGGVEEVTEQEINKIVGDVTAAVGENIGKVLGETVAKTVGDALKPIEERLAKIEAQPMPPATRAAVPVTKKEDANPDAGDDPLAKVDGILEEMERDAAKSGINLGAY